MSGKPAARVSDPTACPIPGHGSNPIVAGSPDVLFDSLPAARMGDPTGCGSSLASAVIPTVLINGKPATVLGTVGNHGNPVIAGSGTVLIGTSGGGAAVSPVAALTMAAIAAPRAASGGGGGGTSSAAAASTAPVAAATASQANNAKQEAIELDYRLKLKSGGNHLLTPLEIPDYDELAGATTKNQESIDFLVDNRKQAADSLTLEVFDGSTLLYSESDTSALLPAGKHPWQWDGYDMAGVLDTQVLKSPNLCIRLTAHKGGQRQIAELRLDNSAEEIDWVDARIDRNAKTIEITVRPSFSDGGVSGKDAKLTAKTFTQLKAMAKAGIERYWSRNGSRTPGIGAAIQTAKGAYKVTVVADVNAEPSAKNFPLIEALDADFGRSTSFAMFKKIYHNQGFWSAARYPADFADGDFEHTAAHEVGHLILNEYGDGGLIPEYSWSHKKTSTVLTQSPLENHPVPGSGEIDVMHYHSDYPSGPSGYQNFWSRSVASEQDVKGLLWLTRVQFDD
jgi:uncharacterized Zn-binding protein involved in type VI secretion